MLEWVENHTYDEIAIGHKATLQRTLTQQDILAFAAVSGDVNPAHLDAQYAAGTVFHGIIAHGMWGGALLSALMGTRFPGPGTIYLEQQLRFVRPVRPGDTLTAEVEVKHKDDKRKQLELDCRVSNQKDELVIVGSARVSAPRHKVRMPMPQLPTLIAVQDLVPA